MWATPPFYVQVLCAASILSSLYNCSLLFEKVAFLRKKKDFLWTCSLDFYGVWTDFQHSHSRLSKSICLFYIVEFGILSITSPLMSELTSHFEKPTNKFIRVGHFIFLPLSIPSEKSVQLSRHLNWICLIVSQVFQLIHHRLQNMFLEDFI